LEVKVQNGTVSWHVLLLFDLERVIMYLGTIYISTKLKFAQVTHFVVLGHICVASIWADISEDKREISSTKRRG
jgi:hypothetical protein